MARNIYAFNFLRAFVSAAALVIALHLFDIVSYALSGVFLATIGPNGITALANVGASIVLFIFVLLVAPVVFFWRKPFSMKRGVMLSLVCMPFVAITYDGDIWIALFILATCLSYGLVEKKPNDNAV